MCCRNPRSLQHARASVGTLHVSQAWLGCLTQAVSMHCQSCRQRASLHLLCGCNTMKESTPTFVSAILKQRSIRGLGAIAIMVRPLQIYNVPLVHAHEISQCVPSGSHLCCVPLMLFTQSVRNRKHCRGLRSLSESVISCKATLLS